MQPAIRGTRKASRHYWWVVAGVACQSNLDGLRGGAPFEPDAGAEANSGAESDASVANGGAESDAGVDANGGAESNGGTDAASVSSTGEPATPPDEVTAGSESGMGPDEAHGDAGAPACPVGSYTSAGLTCMPCPAGTFSAGAGLSTCTPHTRCAAGSFMVFEGSAVADRLCAACPLGTYSQVADADECQPWRECLPGEFVSSSGSSTQDRQCAPCDEGETSSTSNALACLGPGECPAGSSTSMTSDAGEAECLLCDEGEYCPGGDAAQSGCGGDTWDHDLDPRTPCGVKSACAAGTRVADEGTATADRTCVPCEPGTFAAGPNASTCAPFTTCGPGSFVAEAGSAAADARCEPCASGTFSSEANLAACTEWTTCTAPQQHEAGAPAENADRVCATCEPPERTLGDNVANCMLTAFAMEDGLVAFEAEDYHLTTSQGAADFWSVVALDVVSENAYVQVGPESGDFWTSDVQATAPRLDYWVDFTEPGAFHIYIRGDAGSTMDSADSCFVAVGDTLSSAVTFSTTPGSWRWAEVVIQVASPGSQRVSVYAREDGFKLDKLAISAEPLTLDGDGPPNSPEIAR